jgi:hypothetical protein
MTDQVTISRELLDQLYSHARGMESKYWEEAKAALAASAQEVWFEMSVIRPREQDKDVILWAPHGLTYVGRLRSGRSGEPQPNQVAWRCSSSGRFGTPTHWMPFTPPKESK